MWVVDASDAALAEAVFRGFSLGTRNPRIGRQLRGLFLATGLIDVEVGVLSRVVTSWADFRTFITGTNEELVAHAVAHGVASEGAVRALFADLEARDAEGRFFACFVVMRCRGLRPAR